MPWTGVLCLLAAARAALPEGPVIVGYQNWGACDVNETLAAAASGVNVVAWFAINLARNAPASTSPVALSSAAHPSSKIPVARRSVAASSFTCRLDCTIIFELPSRLKIVF